MIEYNPSKKIGHHKLLTKTKSSESSESSTSSSIASLDSICSISLLAEDELNDLEVVQNKILEAKNLEDKETKTKLIEQKRLRLAAAVSIATRQSERHESETDTEDSSIFDSSLQCPDCLTFFTNFRDFFNHLRLELTDASPTRPDENSLLEDRYSHYVINRNYNCLYEICSNDEDEDEDDEALINDGEIIEDEKSDSSLVICPECSKCLSSERTLAIHMKVHRPPEFQCPTCSKMYTWKSGLVYHWAHSKCDKPDDFQFTDKRTTAGGRRGRGGRGRGRGSRGRGRGRGRPIGQSRQIRSDEDVSGPPIGLGGELTAEEETNALSGYPCPHCPKIFSKPALLKQHSAVHEPPKFQCDKCDRWFRWKQGLQNHNPCRPAQ